MTKNSEEIKEYRSLDGKFIAQPFAVHTYASDYKAFQKQVAQLKNVVNIVGKLHADRIVMASGNFGEGRPSETFFKASNLRELISSIFELASQVDSYPLTMNLYSFPSNNMGKLAVVSVLINKLA